jgi:hypothetical protein
LAPEPRGRRLAAEGTSFMLLREEAYYTLACQLLEGTQVPTSQIADYNGCANPRAFLRWLGMGPAQWRASRCRPPPKCSRSRGRD